MINTVAQSQDAKFLDAWRLADTAFTYFHSNNYTCAIPLYKKAISEKKDTYFMKMLALCYAKTDSVEQEKSVLEMATKMAPDLLMNGAFCSATLADLYLKEKDYQKALYYYDLYAVKMKYDRMPDRNMHAYYLYLENDRSKCFEGLNMIDSAVAILTPYVFCTYKDLQALIYIPNDPQMKVDSLKHDSLCTRYLSLLVKLHSEKNVKAEYKKAESSFYYYETKTSLQNGYIKKAAICGFTFYDIPIIYNSYAEEYDPKEKQIPEPQIFVFGRTYQLKAFRNLPLCRMIRALPNKN
jgi:hypothetical protein